MELRRAAGALPWKRWLMFDNPEKLFIILLIALFIFGPQKLIGLGGAMGRAIRDFRSVVRDAHEQFSAAVDEAKKTEDAYSTSEPAALPAPEPIVPVAPTSPGMATPAGEGVEARFPAPGAPPADGDHEGPYSLASEPPAHAVLESLQRKE
jgi:TatA/E family protein of Tat protein translocase